MRTFIAIPLPVEIIKKIEIVQNGLMKGIKSVVSWVQPNSIHLTLKFLGEVENSNVSTLTNKLTTVCRDVMPFSLTCGGLGCFPSPQRPKVIWVGITPDPKLNALVAKIEKSCTELGFSSENRTFNPHLTLGRVKTNLETSDLEFIRNKILEESRNALSSVEVSEIYLMKSDLSPRGAIYSVLSKIAIGVMPDS